MKAILCTQAGPAKMLSLVDLPDPKPATGEVVVDIAFAALNFFDTLIIQGRYQVKPELPFSPAAEFSGVVSAVGGGVTAFRVGDRVCGHCGFGAAREKIAVAAERLVKVPDDLALEQAAGLMVTYGTTLHALQDRAKIQPGETLAVLGASGGVGLAAIELGKILGARVIACASSPEKLAFCKQHGADELLDYSKEDLKERLRALTNGEGADVIYDPVGGKYAEPAVRATAWEGRYLVIGFAAGEIPRIPLNLLLLRGSAALGVSWGQYTRRDPERFRAQIGEMLGWVKSGKLSPHIDHIFPLTEVKDAFAAISGRKVMGKVLLKP